MRPALTNIFGHGHGHSAQRQHQNSRVAIIGAGISGLCAAVQLKRQLGYTHEHTRANFVVFEKAHDVGGVWLANSYPGCAVDAPGWLYSYSFAQRSDWTQFFPDQAEMREYLVGVAKEYDIYRHVRFNTAVVSCEWKEETKTWVVTTRTANPQDGALATTPTPTEEIHEFNIVILGKGPFSEPNYPSVFDSFSGPVIHSGRWNPDISLEGRVVGVVGSGPSAVQLIPAIASATAGAGRPQKLLVYIREPNYVVPKPPFAFARTSTWKRVVGLFPFRLRAFRALSFLGSEIVAAAFDSGSFVNRTLSSVILRYGLNLVDDESTRARLVPRYTFGYKGASWAADSYYQAFNEPVVELVSGQILECDGQSLITQDGADGVRRLDRLDVLILCTGFKFRDYFAHLRVTGSGGVDLAKLWTAPARGRPETFYGVCAHEAPNMFFLMGPNAVSGNTSAIFFVECQVNFIIAAIRGMQQRNAAAIRVSEAAQAKSMREIDEGAKNKVYMVPQPEGTSETWLLNENGFPTLWPKSSTSYWLRTRRLDPSNFEFIRRI